MAGTISTPCGYWVVNVSKYFNEIRQHWASQFLLIFLLIDLNKYRIRSKSKENSNLTMRRAGLSIENARSKFSSPQYTGRDIILHILAILEVSAPVGWELTEYKISTEKIKRCTHRPGYSSVCKSHHDCRHHHHDGHHVELKWFPN